jgi:DNA-directed RNA polymerase subunit F
MHAGVDRVEAVSIFRFTIVLLCPDSSTDIQSILSQQQGRASLEDQTRDIKGVAQLYVLVGS